MKEFRIFRQINYLFFAYFSACYHTKPYVCEDSDQLLDFVRASIRAKGADLEIPEPPEELEVDP